METEWLALEAAFVLVAVPGSAAVRYGSAFWVAGADAVLSSRGP